MELDEVIRRRRMCRSFVDRPVERDVVDRLVERARRAPSAGRTRGSAWLVLEGADLTGQFWALDADPTWLARPSHPGLLRAPVILVPFANADAYRRRYAEADKAPFGRPGGTAAPRRPADPATPARRADPAASQGPADPAASEGPDDLTTSGGPDPWPVPWWDVDTSFAIMLLLLGVVEEGLGALFFALHGDVDRLRDHFGVPAAWHPLGAVAVGWPTSDAAVSPSASGGWPPLPAVLHRGSW